MSGIEDWAEGDTMWAPVCGCPTRSAAKRSLIKEETCGAQQHAELGCSGAIASNTGPNYPLTGVTNM